MSKEEDAEIKVPQVLNLINSNMEDSSGTDETSSDSGVSDENLTQQSLIVVEGEDTLGGINDTVVFSIGGRGV